MKRIFKIFFTIFFCCNFCIFYNFFFLVQQLLYLYIYILFCIFSCTLCLFCLFLVFENSQKFLISFISFFAAFSAFCTLLLFNIHIAFWLRYIVFFYIEISQFFRILFFYNHHLIFDFSLFISILLPHFIILWLNWNVHIEISLKTIDYFILLLVVVIYNVHYSFLKNFSFQNSALTWCRKESNVIVSE